MQSFLGEIYIKLYFFSNFVANKMFKSFFTNEKTLLLDTTILCLHILLKCNFDEISVFGFQNHQIL